MSFNLRDHVYNANDVEVYIAGSAVGAGFANFSALLATFPCHSASLAIIFRLHHFTPGNIRSVKDSWLWKLGSTPLHTVHLPRKRLTF